MLNTTGERTIYAYDVGNKGTKIPNKCSFYLGQDWVPDGLTVAATGVVPTGAGKGVDIIARISEPIMRTQTNYTVQNCACVELDLKEV